MKFFAIALFAFCAACASGEVNRNDQIPLTTVDYVEVDRYLGEWFEIARLPNRFEKNCEGVTAQYSRRDDGLLKVVNTCRQGAPDGKEKRAKGRAKIVDEVTNAKLKVSFFGPFWGDYWIIDLADDYSYAVVGEPSGRFLWILARTSSLSQIELSTILARLQEVGYNTDALYFTKHSSAAQ